MPSVLGGVLGGLLFNLGLPLGIVNFAALTLPKVLLAVGLSYLSKKITGETSEAEDGKVTLSQTVPPRVRAYGEDIERAGDYLFLEEVDGIAYHIITPVSHQIAAYNSFRLHDEEATLDGDGLVTEPEHFDGHVTIKTRVGLDPETAYSEVVAAFPTIWTTAHRCDGVATFLMMAESAAVEDQQTVFPQGMPLPVPRFNGAAIWDPREATEDGEDASTWTTFGRANLALIGLDFLRHRSGYRLTLDEIDLPSFIAAADVCDQVVANRDGNGEPRYHGGWWYGFNVRPADVLKLIAEAGDMVLYETGEGKVAVHAGAFVEPDISLDDDAIFAVTFLANQRPSQTPTAVRGRYTSSLHGYVTADAAPWGDPYENGDRSQTIENSWVRRHNHMQRLQKLAFIRANAARVELSIDYEAAPDLREKRWIRVNKPPYCNDAIVEITGRPRLSLANLSWTIEGIVVPADLYAFDAATEEGEPPPVVDENVSSSLEPPTGIDVAVIDETVSGVAQQYARITWDAGPGNISYQVEYGRADSTAVVIDDVPSGIEEYETPYLADITLYRWRVRSVAGGGQHSAWSDYYYVPDGLLAAADTFLLVDSTTTLHV